MSDCLGWVATLPAVQTCRSVQNFGNTYEMIELIGGYLYRLCVICRPNRKVHAKQQKRKSYGHSACFTPDKIHLPKGDLTPFVLISKLIASSITNARMVKFHMHHRNNYCSRSRIKVHM